MTPSERERVKAALQSYLTDNSINVHDLAARMKAAGRKVDAKVLHRFLERGLQIDDQIMEVYRGFVDTPS